MSIRHLDRFFAPETIAIIGASNRPGSVGAALVDNLKDTFQDRLYLVHPRHKSIGGIPVHARIEDLEIVPDLALIATPPSTVPETVSLLGARGTRAAVIVAEGFDRAGPQLRDELGRAAFAHDVRIVGPGSVGLLVPRIGMNASFAVGLPKSGNLALVSQSGAIMGAVIDWALHEQIGFSRMIALGDKSDVDFADVVDHLASDVHTRAILLCVENISHSNKFLSALRAAARSRPIVALKIGRAHLAGNNGPSVAATQQEADVFAAALRRAGVLQVHDLGQLFGAAEILNRVRSVPGDRLAVMTNGGGVGVLAAERFVDLGGRIAALSSATREQLDALLPAFGEANNPLDMLGDANAEKYEAAAIALLHDKAVDGLVVIHCPTKLADSGAIAGVLAGPVLQVSRKVWPPKPVLVVWLGESDSAPERQLMEAAGLSAFRTPADAVEALTHLLHHDRAQAELMETPPTLRDDVRIDLDAAKGLVSAALADGADNLPEADLAPLLKAFDLPVANVNGPNEPVAIGLGIVEDRVFGPALYVGLRTGDTGATQRTYALPPLNPLLASSMLKRSGLVAEHDSETTDQLAALLVRLGQLCHDLRDVRALDAELVTDKHGRLALNPKRITIAEERRIDGHGVNPRFSIRPYPAQWETRITLKDGRPLTVRPIRPEDERLYPAFLEAVERNDLRLRFFTPNPNLSHEFLARLTQIDYARSMAFAALDERSGDLLGVVRLHIETNRTRGEYAVLVRSNLKGLGLGWQLMQQIIAYGRYDGLEEIYGEVLKENTTMLSMCRALGFASLADAEDGSLMHVTLDLTKQES
ncbi:MAG: GNAT family N-acetyltransferase [Pseudomonadota bacterium]